MSSRQEGENRREVSPGTPWVALLGVATALFFALQFGERWLRTILLYLSNAVWARRLVSDWSIARRVAYRFVAGESIDEVIAVSRDLNEQGFLVTLDYLGESVTTLAEADDACREISRLLDAIGDQAVANPTVMANVSVKLSQLGLKIDPEHTLQHMISLLQKARSHNNKIRIDMEESALVDTTLRIYRTLRYNHGFDNVGVVIQSYLYRSQDDVRRLVEEGAWVRLCKGAYMEPPEVAYPVKADTDANYVRLMKQLLGEEARSTGVYTGFATHDEKMVAATKEFAALEGIGVEEFEFQMLYGIRRELQRQLVGDGYRVRIYVPYGTAWYPYFVRRLAERPANLWFFLSNFVRQ